MRGLLTGALALAVLGGGAVWLLTAPGAISEEQAEALGEGDPERGRAVFFAGGCASCHAAPRAAGEERFLLSGGLRLETEFGDFVAPNISPHPEDGIGGWSVEDLANALLHGVSPEGDHYYPAFPFASYTRMLPADIADLHAFLMTLPEVEGRAPPNELAFPFSLRRGIGLWKMLYLDDAPAVSLAEADERIERGQYLVEALGHCGECHTPRGAIGGADLSQWLAGADAAEGDGKVPNITPHEDGLAGWSEADIAYLLESGFTPEFDSVGGSMAAVVRGMAELPATDREAIAAYLKAIPAHPNGY